MSMDLMRQQRAARLAKEAVEAVERQRSHSENAPHFFDNIDTSAGIDQCHPWTGQRKWNHTEAGGERIKGYEHGQFEYEGCVSRIHTRVLCFAVYGREPPRDHDVVPLCGDHLCSNLRHMCLAPHGGSVDSKLKRAVFVEEFFCEGTAQRAA